MTFTVKEWRPVVGYEGLYEVSSIGQVRSLPRITTDTLGRNRSFPGKLLSLTTQRPAAPYRAVGLCKNGKQITWRVHVLVIAAFVGPRPAGYDVRHLNGDHRDNRIENLVYGTHSENGLDTVRYGNHHLASKTHCLRGHEFTTENTYAEVQPNGNTHRRCRACAIARAKARRIRLHAVKAGAA